MNFNCLFLIVVFHAFLFTLLSSQDVEKLYLKDNNRTITFRTSKDIEENTIFSDIRHKGTLFAECEIFCLQPDIRLCQCSKEELNKYLPSDIMQTSKDQKSNDTMTLPHIYQSSKERKTCGEYSIIIRKLNIAMQRMFPVDQSDFYFEPTIDFQVDSPMYHSISGLFYWGDWIALYANNPYTEYDNFLPGCIWQIPSGIYSVHSSITVPECRSQLLRLLKQEVSKLHICLWSYERFWRDKVSGPCLCCELNFNDCSECYQCFKNNKLDNDEKFSECLLTDRKNRGENLSCYRCLNIKNPTYNCQSYEHYLAKMIQEYQISNKYQVLTKNENSLIDNL